MAYQAKTWRFAVCEGRFSGEDLNTIIERLPSDKIVKRLSKAVNRRHTISPREIIHITDSQSVSRTIKTLRRHIPSAFPSESLHLFLSIMLIPSLSLFSNF